MRRGSGRRSTSTRRRPITTVPCAMSPPGCRRTRSWVPEGAGTMDIGLTQLPSFVPQCRHVRHDGGRSRPGDRRLCGAPGPAGRPPLRRLGDRLFRHGDGDAGPLQLPGQEPVPAKAGIVVLNNGGIGPGMPEIPENPMFNMKPNSLIYGARYDRMMEAFGRQGFLRRGPEGPEGRARRGDEPPRPRPRQRRDLAGRRPQAAAVPLAQLTWLISDGGGPLRRGRPPLQVPRAEAWITRPVEPRSGGSRRHRSGAAAARHSRCQIRHRHDVRRRCS